jgi:hypothetical protein
MTTDKWDHICKDAKHLLMNLLDIEMPVIAVVNGPALIHAEIPVLSDIVICSENAEFQDAPHFPKAWFPATTCTSCGRWCSTRIAAAISC